MFRIEPDQLLPSSVDRSMARCVYAPMRMINGPWPVVAIVHTVRRHWRVIRDPRWIIHRSRGIVSRSRIVDGRRIVGVAPITTSLRFFRQSQENCDEKQSRCDEFFHFSVLSFFAIKVAVTLRECEKIGQNRILPLSPKKRTHRIAQDRRLSVGLTKMTPIGNWKFNFFSVSPSDECDSPRFPVCVT